jgi:hypothetical protein
VAILASWLTCSLWCRSCFFGSSGSSVSAGQLASALLTHLKREHVIGRNRASEQPSWWRGGKGVLWLEAMGENASLSDNFMYSLCMGKITLHTTKYLARHFHL